MKEYGVPFQTYELFYILEGLFQNYRALKSLNSVLKTLLRAPSFHEAICVCDRYLG